MSDHAHTTEHPRTVKASEFKARCLRLMDEVEATGNSIVITKRGRPVSRLVPYRKRPDRIFGIDSRVIEIHGDIVAPLPLAWDAAKGLRGDSED